jgi:hypothetical protein
MSKAEAKKHLKSELKDIIDSLNAHDRKLSKEFIKKEYGSKKTLSTLTANELKELIPKAINFKNKNNDINEEPPETDKQKRDILKYIGETSKKNLFNVHRTPEEKKKLKKVRFDIDQQNKSYFASKFDKLFLQQLKIGDKNKEKFKKEIKSFNKIDKEFSKTKKSNEAKKKRNEDIKKFEKLLKEQSKIGDKNKKKLEKDIKSFNKIDEDFSKKKKTVAFLREDARRRRKIEEDKRKEREYFIFSQMREQERLNDLRNQSNRDVQDIFDDIDELKNDIEKKKIRNKLEKEFLNKNRKSTYKFKKGDESSSYVGRKKLLRPVSRIKSRNEETLEDLPESIRNSILEDQGHLRELELIGDNIFGDDLIRETLEDDQAHLRGLELIGDNIFAEDLETIERKEFLRLRKIQRAIIKDEDEDLLELQQERREQIKKIKKPKFNQKKSNLKSIREENEQDLLEDILRDTELTKRREREKLIENSRREFEADRKEFRLPKKNIKKLIRDLDRSIKNDSDEDKDNSFGIYAAGLVGGVRKRGRPRKIHKF